MMEQKLLASPGRLRDAREIKQAPLSATLRGHDGSFEGYASLFGIADLGNDIVMPGAFAATLKKRGARGIKMLWQHNAAEPIGVWSFISETSVGLYVKGQLNLQVSRAREVHSLMQEGSVDGLSIGFRTEKSVRDRKNGLRHLEKLDLWEISVVTFPMLPQARVSAVKRRAIREDGILNNSETAVVDVRQALLQAANILR